MSDSDAESERANPQVNVEEAVDLSEAWRDGDCATIDFYTNSACAIGRDREDATEGVWLDQQEKRALYEALEDYFDG